MKLHDLGILCGTDKAQKHQYLDIYEKYMCHLRDKPISLLEIGYHKGRSAKMWELYFGNESSTFLAMDNNVNCKEYLKTKIIYGDQSSRKDLAKLAEFGGFDIIIDDGGHMVEQQQVSFGFLFPYVKSKGIYIIEDLHAAKACKGPYNISGTKKITTYMLNKLINESVIDSQFMLEEEERYIETHVEKCIMERGLISEIAFIIKK